VNITLSTASPTLDPVPVLPIAVSATLVEQAANYWAHARYEDLPPEAIAAAKILLLDTLAAGVVGATTPSAQSALAAMVASQGAAVGPCVVWGSTLTLPPVQAALVNGTAAHALELDDFGGCGHTAAVVIPVVAALAASKPASGRDVITAIAAGYDLAARVLEGAGGYRPHNALGWHSTGTCGSFGAAAAAAKMMGLDADTFASALAISGSFTGGIWAYLVDGAMTKHLHPGRAAETGTSAAFLAQAGMSGPRQVLEAPWGGFFSTYAPTVSHPELTLQDLGSAFRIEKMGIKLHACCRGLHACIDALLAVMREEGIDSSQIIGLIAHGDNQTRVQFDRPRIPTLMDAQFSMQYCLAVTAVYGKATLAQFQPLQDGDEIRRLMAHTSVATDRTLAATEYPSVEIRLADGRSIERHVIHAVGVAENPASAADVEAKAEALLARHLDRQTVHNILASIRSFETLTDVGEFLKVFQFSAISQK
jgi:2-methylcitrate dehydratase PrpD